MYITTKKTTSNSINRYHVLDGTYQDAIDLYRADLNEILSNKLSHIRTHMTCFHELPDNTVVEATKQLLSALDKPSRSNPNVTNVDYRGLKCQYNKNTKKHYFGFMCGEITRLVIDENDQKKPRTYRSDLTRCKSLIRRYCLNWITIMIDDDTIIEK